MKPSFDVVDSIGELDEIIANLAAKRRGTIAWDIDGTLFDPHPRMLETLRAFGVKEIDPKRVDRSWEITAQNFNLKSDAFYPFWNEFYWKPAHFIYDAPIAKTVDRLRTAQEKGVRNIVVTGRRGHYHDVTSEQLKTIDIVADAVVTKPGSAETPAYKGEVLRELIRSGSEVGAFVTDCVHEIRAVQTITTHHGVAVPRCFLCVPRGHTSSIISGADDLAVLKDIRNEQHPLILPVAATPPR